MERVVLKNMTLGGIKWKDGTLHIYLLDAEGNATGNITHDIILNNEGAYVLGMIVETDHKMRLLGYDSEFPARQRVKPTS